MIISICVMILMSVFFVLGALDRLFGNRFGLGGELERAFGLMGPTALSVIGLLVLAPVLAGFLQEIIAPVFGLIGADTGMFPGMFMSSEISYPLAAEMASSQQMAAFSGIIVGSVMGAVISFSIPVACGLIRKQDYRFFATGILAGYIFDPVASFIGGLSMGLSPKVILVNLIPVIIVAVILIVGLALKPEIMINIFRAFSKLLMAIITVGLAAAAVEAMTGLVVVPGMNPISDGFRTVGTIILSIGGSMPLLYVLGKLLSRPLKRFAGLLGINEISSLNILVGLTSIVPGYSSYEKMNGKGKIIFSALTASAIPMLGCHLGFTASVDTAMILPMLLSRCCAGIFAVLSASFFSRRIFSKEELEAA